MSDLYRVDYERGKVVANEIMRQLIMDGKLVDHGTLLRRQVEQTVCILEFDYPTADMIGLALISALAQADVPVRYVRPDLKELGRAGKRAPDKMWKWLGDGKSEKDGMPPVTVVPLMLSDLAGLKDEAQTLKYFVNVATSLNAGYYWNSPRHGFVAPFYVVNGSMYQALHPTNSWRVDRVIPLRVGEEKV